MKNYILLMGMFTLASCALNKVDYKMPSTRFQAPEVTGGEIFNLDIKGRANVNFASSNRVTTASHLADVVGNNETDNLSVESAGQFGIKLDISIFDRLDMYWSLATGSPVVGGFKWQWLGKTENQYARGWKGSVAFGWGVSKSDPQMLPAGSPTTDDYWVKNDMWTYDLSIQFGYRFNERIILYANGFFNAYNSDIAMVPAHDDSLKDQQFNIKSDNFGGLLGLKYYFKNKLSYVDIEVGGSKGQVSVENLSNEDLAFGVNFGWIFE